MVSTECARRLSQLGISTSYVDTDTFPVYNGSGAFASEWYKNERVLTMISGKGFNVYACYNYCNYFVYLVVSDDPDDWANDFYRISDRFYRVAAFKYQSGKLKYMHALVDTRHGIQVIPSGTMMALAKGVPTVDCYSASDVYSCVLKNAYNIKDAREYIKEFSKVDSWANVYTTGKTLYDSIENHQLFYIKGCNRIPL